jgi:hypothetical protein
MKINSGSLPEIIRLPSCSTSGFAFHFAMWQKRHDMITLKGEIAAQYKPAAVYPSVLGLVFLALWPLVGYV